MKNQLPDVPGVRHKSVLVDGARLHIAEAGDETADAIVLLHGFPQHWYMWRHVMGGLSRTHRVVAIDLRGFGWSDAPKRGYATSDRISDVLGVLDRLGIDRADFVGHDWGAWLAFRLALDHADRVHRLVAISMVHPWVMQRHLIPNVWRWWVTALFEIPGVGERMLRRRPDVTAWLLSRDAHDPTVWTPELRHTYTAVAAEPARALAGRKLHVQLVLHDIAHLILGRDRKRALSAPTLIIGGKHDALLPPSVLTVPRRHGHRVRVQTIFGGHFLVDENPERVLELVSAHLNSGEESR